MQPFLLQSKRTVHACAMNWLNISFEDTAAGSSDTDTVFLLFNFNILLDFLRVNFSFFNDSDSI